MNTNFLAPYIWKNEEWLEMALHVYKAMPAVREHLIEAIFKAAGKRVAKELDGVERQNHEHGVYLWTEETRDCYVFACAEKRDRQRGLKLVAGIYDAESKETRERFAKKIDLETWSDGEYDSDGYIGAWVNDKHEGGRWDDDAFLDRAILHRDEVVKNVADLLIHIYKGMWPR